MNSSELQNKKFKYYFIKNVIIRDPTINDINEIINLFIGEYGLNYQEQFFYNKTSVKNLIFKASEDRNLIWKCAFHNNTLIGQTILVIENSIGLIKSTIILKKYRNLKVLSLLGYYLAKEIKELPAFDLKYIYAIIDKDNLYVTNFTSKYKFIELAQTPMWDINRFFYIFGRKSFNFTDKWTSANLDFNLFKKAYYLIKKANLKIHSQAYLSLKQIDTKNSSINLRTEENNDIFSNKILIFLSIDDQNEELCAEVSENLFLKSWYNFRFIDNFSYTLKVNILNFVFKLFEKSNKINSLSLIIGINDYEIQNFLFRKNVLFFGLLPFYLKGEHAILMGKSKIKGGLQSGS